MKELLELTLFGSVWIFWSFVFLALILYFVSEKHEDGRIGFVYSVVFVCCLFVDGFDFSRINIDYFKILSYLGIGLLFAIIKSYFYGRYKNKEYISEIEGEKDEDADEVLSRYKKESINDLKNNVFRWWFMWPVSLIYWSFSDLLSELYNFVYSKISKVFSYMFSLGFKN